MSQNFTNEISTTWNLSLNATGIPLWTFTSVLEVITSILTFSLNGFVLGVFIVESRLRSPFTAYLMALLSANIIYAAIQNPFDIIGLLYLSWWRLDSCICSLYLYGNWVFGGIPIHVHSLITINRIWALWLPASYRCHHNTKVAVFLCITSCVYVHLITLPGLLIDQISYTAFKDFKTCELNAEQIAWTTVTMLLIYDLPIFFIISAYPLLLYKYLTWRRVSFRKDTIIQPRRMPHRGQKSAFSALTFMTISITVCWSPGELYYTVKSFIDVDIDQVRQTGTLLYSFQPVIDPLIFMLTQKDFRRIIRQRIFG